MKRSNIAFFFGSLIFFIMQKTIALPYVEGDSAVIPFSALYQNSWGGENTRLKTNIFDKNKDFILPLQVNESDSFVFPTLRKTHVCSPYGIRSGRMHTGMDIKQNLGDSIVAAWGGIVRMANKNYYAYGGTVVIRHYNGLETIYAHLSGIYVVENQVVTAGKLIGFAGRTGRATTEHLHFETRFLYEHFDPRTIIDFNTFALNADTLYIKKGKFSGSFSFSPEFEEMEDQISDSTIVMENLEEMEDQPVKKTNIAVKTPSQPSFYIIKKGDTLSSISKTYKININTLCKINNITQESILQIGQKLKLEY